MRLMFTTLLAVILSAAFSTPAAISVDPYDQPAPQPSPALAPPLSWGDFKVKYGKHYASLAEEHYRSHVFARGMRKIILHNMSPGRSYDMSPNAFLDVEATEFQEVYTRISPSDAHSWNASREYIRKRGERGGRGRRRQRAG
jgi:hypothetical protein